MRTRKSPLLDRLTPARLCLGLILCQLVGAAALFSLGEGALRLAAGLLAVAGGALALLVLRRDPAQRELVELLRAANGEQIDLSGNLDVPKGSSYRELAAQYNTFAERMRALIEEFQQRNFAVGLASAQARLLAEYAARDASRQDESSDLVFRSSDETATAAQEVTKRASSVAQMNSRNLDTARRSLEELSQVSRQIGTVTDMMQQFKGTVAELGSSSGRIREILETVQGFADQTNMLALNAAIEAARAGEHGRGFAVVADEVRGLASKVGQAASEIRGLLEQMTSAVAGTQEGTHAMLASSGDARTAVEAASGQFGEMVKDFQHAHDDLLLVGSAIEELSVTNRESHGHSTAIRELGIKIRKDMEQSFTQADALRDSTNLVLQQLCRFRIGRGKLEAVTEILQARRAILEQVMERLQDEGVDLFDRNYRPIEGTKPQKHDVSWAQPFRRATQHLIDEWVEGIEGSLYCVPTDDRGYLPVARKENSYPPTGDPKVDAVKSAFMIFSVTNPVEVENLNKCTYVSMGTFVLPNGKIVFALFVPLEVRGRRWGTLGVGLLPKALGLH